MPVDFPDLKSLQWAAELQDTVQGKIRSLADLQDGWDYGEGVRPSKETIEAALNIYLKARDYVLDVEVYPVGNGTIELSFSYEDRFVDVIVKPGSKYELYCEVGIGQNFEVTDLMINATDKEINKHLRIGRRKRMIKSEN